MHDRMLEYAMHLIPEHDDRKLAADDIKKKRINAFQEKITALLDLIRKTPWVSNKKELAEKFELILSQMFLLSNKRDAVIHFDDIHTLQMRIVKEAAAHIQADKEGTIKNLIADLNNNKIEKKLVSALAASCQHVINNGQPSEQALALANKLFAEYTDIFNAKIFGPDKFFHCITSTSELELSCRKPISIEHPPL